MLDCENNKATKKQSEAGIAILCAFVPSLFKK
jgi:hypothetical protein